MSLSPPGSPPVLDRLRDVIRQIDDHLEAARRARALPDVRERAVTSIDQVLPHGTPGDDPRRLIFRRIRDQVAAQERAQGEIARDRELKRLAYHMDRLRADLERLAREARFALVDVSREWRA